jgi:hypothetical protein
VTTVDRQKWIADRIRFLDAALEAGVTDAERSAIEAEIETLRREARVPRRWLRWLFGLPRRRTDR